MGELYIMQIGRPYTDLIQKTINVSDVEDLGRDYVGDLGLVGCGRPLTCRMQKTLKGFHVGKRARILLKGLEGMEVLDRWEVLKGLKGMEEL